MQIVSVFRFIWWLHEISICCWNLACGITTLVYLFSGNPALNYYTWKKLACGLLLLSKIPFCARPPFFLPGWWCVKSMTVSLSRRLPGTYNCSPAPCQLHWRRQECLPPFLWNKNQLFGFADSDTVIGGQWLCHPLWTCWQHTGEGPGKQGRSVICWRTCFLMYFIRMGLRARGW